MTHLSEAWRSVRSWDSRKLWESRISERTASRGLLVFLRQVIARTRVPILSDSMSEIPGKVLDVLHPGGDSDAGAFKAAILLLLIDDLY